MLRREWYSFVNIQVEGKAEISVLSVLLSEVNNAKDKEARENAIRSLTGTAYSGSIPPASTSAP